MEIKDLRIGNIVWHLTTNNSEDVYYRYSKVVRLFDSNIVELKEYYSKDGENMVFRKMYEAKKIQGFPLTSRILKNNGFAVNGKGLTFSECNSLMKDGKETGLFCSFEKVYIPLAGTLRIKAEYVHTFQNILNLMNLNDEIKIE